MLFWNDQSIPEKSTPPYYTENILLTIRWSYRWSLILCLWEGRSRNLAWNTGWSYISHPINPKPFHHISLHLQIRSPIPYSCHCDSSHPKQELTLFTPTLHCYVSSVLYPTLPCFHVSVLIWAFNTIWVPTEALKRLKMSTHIGKHYQQAEIPYLWARQLLHFNSW